MRIVDRYFSFMESYYRSIKKINDRFKRLSFLESIIEYGLYQTDPKLNSDLERAFFEEIKAHIDLSQHLKEVRQQNGQKGGAPKGNKNAQNNQEQPKTTENNQKQANRIRNRNELEIEKNRNELYKDLPSDLLKALKDYEDMRKKIKSPLTDRAREMILKELFERTSGNAEEMIRLLNKSTMNGWKRIVYPEEENKISGSKKKNYTPTDIVRLGTEMMKSHE